MQKKKKNILDRQKATKKPYTQKNNWRFGPMIKSKYYGADTLSWNFVVSIL